jgi:hypothetical protein
MQLFCPTCQAAFAGLPRCPRCGALLLMPQEAAVLATAPRDNGGANLLRPSPAARVVIGTVLALGSYLGLRKVFTGGLVASAVDPAEWWLTTDGLSVVFSLQAIAVLFGAVLAGAGRTRGFPLGVAIGGLCGGLFLAAEVLEGAPPGLLVLSAQPLVLAVGGGIAGMLGCRLWPTPPELELPVPAPSKMSSIQLGIALPPEPPRPTSWVRILAGAAIMVAGVGLTDKVRHGAQKYSGGLLKVESQAQGRFLSWQFATLVILTGGAVAGAGTGAGLRHGILAAALGAAGVFGLTVARGEATPPITYWLDKLHLNSGTIGDPTVVAAVAGGVLIAGLVGGWLGGALFLPLAPPDRRARRLRLVD